MRATAAGLDRPAASTILARSAIGEAAQQVLGLGQEALRPSPICARDRPEEAINHADLISRSAA
ncbi:MAG: hypothetical protein ACRDX8_10305 [Acidimicrobiales bacterium]